VEILDLLGLIQYNLSFNAIDFVYEKAAKLQNSVEEFNTEFIVANKNFGQWEF